MKVNRIINFDKSSEIIYIDKCADDVATTSVGESVADEGVADIVTGKFMYKNVLRKIYMNVEYKSDKKDSSDSKKLPRVVDYAREVINYFKERGHALVFDGEEIEDPKRIEREVGYALESLKSEGVLGKIGTKYVPKALALEHEGKAYLLKYLHLKEGRMMLENRQTLIFPLVNFKRKPLEELNNEPNELKEDEDTQNIASGQTAQENTLTDVEKLQQELLTIKEQMLNSSKEIEELKEKFASFAEERRIRNRIHNLKINLKKYIGLEYCSWVFEVDNSIVVLLDVDDEDIMHEILGKLIFLIKEINENKAREKAAAAKKAKAEKRKSRKNKG